MTRGRRLAVLIPAGPADDAPDTVASVLHYAAEPVLVAVVDDTRGRRPDMAALRSLGPPVVVLPAGPARPGTYGGLWTKLAAGMRHIVENADFDLLLRLDADALLLTRGLEEAARERFAADPGLGALGSYRVGPDGGARDWTYAARVLRIESGLLGLRKPALRRRLRALLAEARASGYVFGEHVLGGACVYRKETVHAMHRRGLLDLPELSDSNAGEDFLFGLLTAAAGYRLGDFGGPGDPMALRWKGLPAAPERLVAEGRAVTHSVRFYEDLDEREIREYFAGLRAADRR
ncbi:hypothetical protein [Actinomadura hibisca]|uniref:hypothetical protein n=1 Tax=Actinomadura hibisca TaxID=68565 RepID=UPI00082CD975|nr:hypothetical protein [Actinomadura hibisca]